MIQMTSSPIPLYFVRLPDDDREPAKIVAGAFHGATHKIMVRGLWSPDMWDAFKNHPMWQEPQPLLLNVMMNPALGVVLALHVAVNLRDVPEEALDEILRLTRRQGPPREPWEAVPETPLSHTILLEIGRLVRAPHAFEYGGSLMHEAVTMFNNALAGKVE